ncbi:MAG: glycosyltransferase family 2 protein [Eubacteriales bacterium]|nr:glycosyltransferase family 2 protein [Eubacteriales bacterium]
MLTQPLVSVIVPVYNVEHQLRRCLDSLRAQTHKNLEIWLIDDGSRDDSGRICDEYARVDERFHAVHQRNGGPSEARNTAMDQATGEYWAFVDSDDFVEPDFIAFLLENLLRENADISICGYTEMTRTGEVTQHGQDVRRVIRGREIMKVLLENVWFKDYFWNKLYRPGLFEGLRFIPGRIYEDVELQYRVFQRAKTVVFHNLPKYCYVETPNSIQHGGFRPPKLDAVLFCQNIRRRVEENYPEYADIARAKEIRCAAGIVHEIARSQSIPAFRRQYHECLELVQREYGPALKPYFDRTERIKLALMRRTPDLYPLAARAVAFLKGGGAG